MRTPTAPCFRARASAVFEARQSPPASIGNHEFAGYIREPWLLRVDASTLRIRPTGARDLSAVAAMHARCSARSLLDRFHRGGRPPAVAALDYLLRAPLSFAATTRDGDVVATAVAVPDVMHGDCSAQVGLLVEDAWHGLGLARELMTHLAGSARAAGYTDLVAYPGTNVVSAQRLLIGVGRTRVVPDATDLHLHTSLPDEAALGVGAVRELLVG